jgi:hypothetical protein
MPPTATGNEESPLRVDGTICEDFDSLLIPNINETWYPSMIDQKPYDFRAHYLQQSTLSITFLTSYSNMH